MAAFSMFNGETLSSRTVWFNTGSTIHFLRKLSQKRAYEVAHSLVGGLSNAWTKLLRKVCDGQTVQLSRWCGLWSVWRWPLRIDLFEITKR